MLNIVLENKIEYNVEQKMNSLKNDRFLKVRKHLFLTRFLFFTTFFVIIPFWNMFVEFIQALMSFAKRTTFEHLFVFIVYLKQTIRIRCSINNLTFIKRSIHPI